MKDKKISYSYGVKKIKVVDKENNAGEFVKIFFRDKNNNLLKKVKYPVYNIEKLYNQIYNGESIDVSNYYVFGFSIRKYKQKYHLKPDDVVTIKNWKATGAFFESDETIDFSMVAFEGEFTLFNQVDFGVGNLSFFKTSFNTSLVDFSDTSFGYGNNSFKYAVFSKGLKTFENAVFLSGNLSFVNTSFNDGKISFKNVNFGDGNVSFHYASFGRGSIDFERTVFRGEHVNFSKVDFGTGKVDFRKADFGHSEALFEETMLKESKIVFRRVKFLSSSLSFKNSDYSTSLIVFDETYFGEGKVSFAGIIAKSISLKSTNILGYIDFRVRSCEIIDLSNAIIHNIIDLKKGIYPVNINYLYLYGVRNLGKLFISWEENNIPQIIGQQPKTSFHQKAEQFRLLKEDFHIMGRYDDEDKAYIEFKRNELRSKLHSAKKKGIIQQITTLFSFGFQTLVFDYMGKYATSPLRVLRSVFMVYGMFSIIYFTLEFFQKAHISCIPHQAGAYEIFVDTFYFSAVTFLTIGYGDCIPTGVLKIIAPLEGWLGVFMMSYFTVAFVRKILR